MLLDIYSWQGIKNLIRHQSQKIKKITSIFFWSITLVTILSLIINLVFSGINTGPVLRVYSAGFFFLVYLSKLFFCLFLFIEDIYRLFRWLVYKTFIREAISDSTHDLSEQNIEGIELIEKPKNGLHLTRSQFISRAALLTTALPFIILTRGITKGAYNYKIRRVQLHLPKLPKAFDGLKILQISDIHSGSFTDKDGVNNGIKMIVDEKADIVFFTGDMVNNRSDEFNPWQDLFSQIKAPMGVFSTLGNHDYGDYVLDWKSPDEKKKNLDDLIKAQSDLGWKLLRNEHVIIDKKFQNLAILGVENWGDRGRFQKFGDIDKAKYHMPESMVKLLLSHDPSHFDSIVSKHHKDIDVTFSGHTHGFQFGFEIGNLKWSPSQYIYPHWAGLYEVEKQKIYVNRGFGFLGFPGRVGILPEITVFTLSKEI